MTDRPGCRVLLASDRQAAGSTSTYTLFLPRNATSEDSANASVRGDVRTVSVQVSLEQHVEQDCAPPQSESGESGVFLGSERLEGWRAGGLEGVVGVGCSGLV